jgi:ribosomal protein S18 acetylase RimI-like enzyme
MQGARGRVLQRVEGLPRERGIDRVRLDVAADNRRLQRWYDERDYRAVGTRTFAHGQNRLTVTLREKPLPPLPEPPNTGR